MVTAILSVDVGDRLEPLRKILGMTVVKFKEGAFSWRGFLYYKWVLGDLGDMLSATLKSIFQRRLRNGRRPSARLLPRIRRQHGNSSATERAWV